jgi:DNA-binding transcriptional MerR regulator
MDQEERFTVNQVSRMAGISRRTLHYYDQIGLVRPSSRAENGYRQYAEDDLLRLQQVLYYRELGFSLNNIQKILDRPDFDLHAALEEHHQALLQRQLQLGRLIETVERTISYLKGTSTMKSE